MQAYGSQFLNDTALGCENYKYDTREYWECYLRAMRDHYFLSLLLHLKNGTKKRPDRCCRFYIKGILINQMLTILKKFKKLTVI